MDVHPPIGKETLEIGFFVSASRQQCTATASTTPFFPFCHGENIARGPDTTSVHVFFGGNVDSATDPFRNFVLFIKEAMIRNSSELSTGLRLVANSSLEQT